MQPLLKVQALCKTFNVRAGLFSRKKFEVLKNISFCVGKGESIAIIGETGAGKSTLAKLLSGADSADSGQILLENNIIEDNGVILSLMLVNALKRLMQRFLRWVC